MVYGKPITLHLRGFSDMRDITPDVEKIIASSGITNGAAVVFVTGSTASISTVEYEPALAQDVRDALEHIAPKDRQTRHGETWGDDNGFSHIRATLMGPGITVPFTDGKLELGTWQQIVVIDHDNRARERRVFVQVMGE